MKLDIATIVTTLGTAACTVLATMGTITATESTELVTSGGAAIAACAAFVAVLCKTVKAHRSAKDGNAD